MHPVDPRLSHFRELLKSKSFGGNRSAAGRYAAEVRWGKKDTKPVSDRPDLKRGARVKQKLPDGSMSEAYTVSSRRGDVLHLRPDKWNGYENYRHTFALHRRFWDNLVADDTAQKQVDALHLNEVDKAQSFSGNRSEAGRYAARIRWANHSRATMTLEQQVEAMAAQSEAAVLTSEAMLEWESGINLRAIEANMYLEAHVALNPDKAKDAPEPLTKEDREILSEPRQTTKTGDLRDWYYDQPPEKQEQFLQAVDKLDNIGKFVSGGHKEREQTVREKLASGSRKDPSLHWTEQGPSIQLQSVYDISGRESGDKMRVLEYFAQKHGLHKGAQTANEEQFKALMATGRFVVVYRGTREENIRAYTTTKPFIGSGLQGAGMYVSYSRARAGQYAKDENDLVPMLIPKSAIRQGRMEPNAWYSPKQDVTMHMFGVNLSHGRPDPEEFKFTADFCIQNLSMVIIGPVKNSINFPSDDEAMPAVEQMITAAGSTV